MRIFIKNKIISLGGSSTATDESGQDVYKIKGKFFTLTRKKYIKSMDDEVLYTVRNRFFNFFVHATYIKDADGNKIAKVRNHFFTLKSKYSVEGLSDNITVEGDFFSFNMTVFRNGVPIGNIFRDFSIIRDAFILDSAEEDVPFLVALVIAIDNIIDNRRAS